MEFTDRYGDNPMEGEHPDVVTGMGAAEALERLRGDAVAGNKRTGKAAVIYLSAPAGGAAGFEDGAVAMKKLIQPRGFLRAFLVWRRHVHAIPVDHLVSLDFGGRTRGGQATQLLRADGNQLVIFQEFQRRRARLALPVIAAADAQQAGADQNSHAISSAISIIWVKVSRTSWGLKDSPVNTLSEIVSSDRAFFPARAAFRYRA